VKLTPLQLAAQMLLQRLHEFLGETDTTSAGRADVAATLALGANTEVDIDQEEKDNEYVVTVTALNAAATGTIELVMFYVVD